VLDSGFFVTTVYVGVVRHERDVTQRAQGSTQEMEPVRE